MSVASQLREASERLSSNGFPSAAQLVDAAKPEPIRMDFDVAMTSPKAVVAPEAIDVPNPTPAPPARRGRRRAPAQAPDPAPSLAPPATPPPITPERQAQINALFSAKARRDADRLQETHSFKVKLASTERMTKEFMSLLKEKEPGYAQLQPRSLASKVVAAYDALASRDGWRVKRDADKERQAIAQSEQESIDERYQRLVNARWSRGSKRADA